MPFGPTLIEQVRVAAWREAMGKPTPPFRYAFRDERGKDGAPLMRGVPSIPLAGTKVFESFTDRHGRPVAYVSITDLKPKGTNAWEVHTDYIPTPRGGQGWVFLFRFEKGRLRLASKVRDWISVVPGPDQRTQWSVTRHGSPSPNVTFTPLAFNRRVASARGARTVRRTSSPGPASRS